MQLISNFKGNIHAFILTIMKPKSIIKGRGAQRNVHNRFFKTATRNS